MSLHICFTDRLDRKSIHPIQTTLQDYGTNLPELAAFDLPSRTRCICFVKNKIVSQKNIIPEVVSDSQAPSESQDKDELQLTSSEVKAKTDTHILEQQRGISLKSLPMSYELFMSGRWCNSCRCCRRCLKEVNTVISSCNLNPIHRVSPELGRVGFASTEMGWYFNLTSFAKMYRDTFCTSKNNLFDITAFTKRLWGSIWYISEHR